MKPSQCELLCVRALSAKRKGRLVLDRVDLDLNEHEILAVVGPNGAGKTTLLEAIAGLIPHELGRFECPPGTSLSTFHERAAVFGWMPDEARLPEEVDVRALLRPVLSAEPAGADSLLDGLSIGESLLDRRGHELSRGESKRVMLAQTLGLRRPITLLDEPFGAFDPLQLDAIIDVIRTAAAPSSGRRAIVVTVHQLSTAARVADRILLLAQGKRIAFGTIPELAAEAAKVEGYPPPDLGRDDGLVTQSNAPTTPDLEAIFRRLLS